MWRRRRAWPQRRAGQCCRYCARGRCASGGERTRPVIHVKEHWSTAATTPPTCEAREFRQMEGWEASPSWRAILQGACPALPERTGPGDCPQDTRRHARPMSTALARRRQAATYPELRSEGPQKVRGSEVGGHLNGDTTSGARPIVPGAASPAGLALAMATAMAPTAQPHSRLCRGRERPGAANPVVVEHTP